MQYNKEEFRKYYRNYIDITSRIEDIKKTIDNLLEDEKLKETLSFYNSLDKEKQAIFNRINCNTDFIRYKLNIKALEEYETALQNLYQDFLKSEAFPFSKDEFHFFVSEDNYLIDAITLKDTSNLTSLENELIEKSITSIYMDSPKEYTKSDIDAIRVSYLRNKDKYNNMKDKDVKNMLLLDTIIDEIYAAQINDKKITGSTGYEKIYKEKWKIKLWKEKLNKQQQIIINSDSKNKDLLLFSIRAAAYEVELLNGARINELYDKINNKITRNEHEMKKKELELDALTKAYYNLTNQDFRKNSGYYQGNEYEYMFANYTTTNPEVNQRVLKMMKR